MLEIWTEAQPTLKRAGRVRYHATFKVVYIPSSSGGFMKGGYKKIPRKVGTTKKVPKI